MATDTQFIGLGWAGDTGGQDRSTIQATIKPHENRASQGYPQKSSRRGGHIANNDTGCPKGTP
jgi:hypothetical protein